MKHIRLGLFIILIAITACREQNNESVAQITESLREYLNDPTATITNSVELIDATPLEALPVIPEAMEITTIDQVQVVPEAEVMYQRPPTQQVAQKSKPRPNKRTFDPNVVQQEAYIKIGTDRSVQTVSRKKSQKITVAVFPKRHTVTVDVYLYAIPVSSPLVRNYNTLIGYAKGVEFIHGQAQFTRYWLGKRADGRPLAKGRYNVYAEYHYNNARGEYLGHKGRYWGGNHRRWTVTVQ